MRPGQDGVLAALVRAACLFWLCALRASAAFAALGGATAVPAGSLDLALYEDHPEVRSELRYFQGRGRPSMQRWLERSGAFLPMIRGRLAQADLPEDLCWLPMIESGFSNTAISHKGAAGIWQFMPETARRYGLRVDRYVDERRNPFKATSAAVRHLSDLMERFGSPFLAAAAYNAGAGQVVHGLGRLGDDETEAGPSYEDADFFRLADASLLARETRQYVPRLIAASLIAREPDRFGFRRRAQEGLQVDSLVVHKATRLDEIARVAGISERLVRQLNPEYVRGVTPPRSRSIVLLPSGLSQNLENRVAALPAAAVDFDLGTDALGRGGTALRAHRGPGERAAGGAGSARHVKVRKGESLAEVAQRAGVSPAELARVNLLPPGYRLHPSQILRLP